MQVNLYGKRILVYKKAVDFRKSIDGLSSLIMQELNLKPQDNVYIFYNQNLDKLKCLSWHKTGFILLYKRLEKHKFYFKFNKHGVIDINAQELGWLLAGLDWQKMRHWQELNYDKFN